MDSQQGTAHSIQSKEIKDRQQESKAAVSI